MFSRHLPFYLLAKKSGEYWYVSKKYKDKSEIIERFPTQKEADEYARKLVLEGIFKEV
jgi:hypothetical protein